MSDPAKYRTREEVQKIREEKDPIDTLRSHLIEKYKVSEKEFKGIDGDIKAIVTEASDFALDSPDQGYLTSSYVISDSLGYAQTAFCTNPTDEIANTTINIDVSIPGSDLDSKTIPITLINNLPDCEYCVEEFYIISEFQDTHIRKQQKHYL